MPKETQGPPELSWYISVKVSSFLKSEQFREKFERERGKILTDSKKRGHDGKNDDDDDEFDDNAYCVYRDSEGKVVSSFKPCADDMVNNLLEVTYNLSKFWYW